MSLHRFYNLVENELETYERFDIPGGSYSGLLSFLKAIKDMLNGRRLQRLDINRMQAFREEVLQADYILETWGRFTMMARCVDSHECVAEPLAEACLEHMGIQWWG